MTTAGLKTLQIRQFDAGLVRKTNSAAQCLKRSPLPTGDIRPPGGFIQRAISILLQLLATQDVLCLKVAAAKESTTLSDAEIAGSGTTLITVLVIF